MKTSVVFISDLVNPKTGKTYKQENLELQHNIPLGTLVECEDGTRLFVVLYERDCDGTPLYSLSFDKEWTEDMYSMYSPLCNKFVARFRISNGWPEESLKIII